MKNLLLSYSLLITTSILSQNERIIFSLSLTESIFTGYHNLITLSFTKKPLKSIFLHCSECDEIKPNSSSKNEWLIRTSNAGSLTIIATNKAGQVIGSRTFNVIEPSLPIVYLDSVNAQSIVTEIPQKIHVALHPSIPTNIIFIVTKWSITLDNKTYDGSGRTLSDELKNAIRQQRSGILIMEINYMTPFGKRFVKELIEFKI